MSSTFLYRLMTFAAISSLTNLAGADIFGADDRVEALASSARPYTQSVAIGVLSSLWEEDENGSSHLIAESFGSDFLCKDENFSNQKFLSYACTGFLVGPDLLVTAGHCATYPNTEIENESELYCKAYTWMFDYYESTDTNNIPEYSIYRCDKIIYATYKGKMNTPDFALIKLDRPVKNRSYLKISSKESLYGQKVSMLGHPMGAPMKFANNAFITAPTNKMNKSYFTNLDALSGNSGSPVFNETYEVIGLLVGGLPNFTTYYDKKNHCERYNHCDDDGKNCVKKSNLSVDDSLPNTFSEVQRVSLYKDLIDNYNYRYL